MITIKEFGRLDLRVGTILKASPLPEARHPAYKLEIDFGPLGIKNSSAQIQELYLPENLVGRQVVAVVNFPPKRIAGFLSQVLVLGAESDTGAVRLLETDGLIPNGAKVS